MMERIGVFVCWCGSNISETVDVKAVAKSAQKQQGVVVATDYKYMCSESGQSLICDTIKKYNLTGIVVCSCSPRMHEATFRKAAESVGLNPYMVEIANIREQCSWIHKDKKKATEKAVTLTKSAIAKLRLNIPLTASNSKVTKRALVIGGGIAGMQTALDVAEAGFEVDIVEKTPSIGGKMAQIDKTFPTLDCSACILTPKMVDVSSHEKINIYTYSEIKEVRGFVGNFSVDICKKARSIDTDKCVGCGICIDACPSKNNKNEFNMGLNNRKAIHIPFAQAIPNVPVIDREACIKFKTGKCGLCQIKCEANAIDFQQTDEIVTKEYGAVIVATGYNPINIDKFDEFQYSVNEDVITSLELERLMNADGPTKGKVLKPSNKEKPKDIVFIQCVGSRGDSCREKSYCSKVCCMYTAKHTMLIRDKYPDINVHVFYIDIRTAGKSYDEFYRRAVEDYGVEYIKGMVGKVSEQSNNKLMVQGSDLLSNEQIFIETDMVVLATAIEPDETAKNIAGMLSASIDSNNFFTEAHPKLRPVESPTSGVYLSGVCQGPKDIPETVAQAGAAASKVIGLLNKESLKNNPCIAHSNELMCNGCSLCQNVCAYGAIDYIEKEIKDKGVIIIQRIAKVNEAVCQGCGACTVICKSGAMDLKGFSTSQIIAEVDAICN